MDVITDPAAVAVGDFGTASEANSYKNAIDAIVRRIGGKATTNATQAIAANTNTTLNNGGSAVWTATEDSGGFVSGTGGTSTPLVIPTGKGGLYTISLFYVQAVNSASVMWATLLVNGAGSLSQCFANGGGQRNASTTVPLPLNAGDTLGIQARSDTATNISAACWIACYRIGN